MLVKFLGLSHDHTIKFYKSFNEQYSILKEKEQMLLLHYPSWTSSRKAKAWLDENEIAYDLRLIHKDNPKADEVKKWMAQTGLDLKKILQHKRKDVQGSQPQRALG